MSTSGLLCIDEGIIRYRSTAGGDWDLTLSDVRIIGECTNQMGPFADDYFFCFATGPDMWFEASFYAEGREEFLGGLSARLSFPIVPHLQWSTDFASRVLWPPSLAGANMFEYTDVPGTEMNEQTYTEEVAAMLGRRS